VTTSDEIGYVADQMNSMIRALGQNIAHREKLAADLQTSLDTDRLTETSSRRRFLGDLRAETDRSRRYKGSLSLLLLDIDRLTEVNDRHGSETGDYVLTTVATIVRHNIRRTDHVGRWSGGVLAILVPETSLRGARYVGEKLRRNVEVNPFDTVGRITVSVGAVAFDGEESADDLVKRAEAAVAAAKSAGGNRLVAEE
jgi:diguanylate cyclase (GGDEF)-like protein